MLDTPARGGRVEDEYRGTLRPFRTRPVLPVTVAGIKPAAMRDEGAQLGAAHEAARSIV